MFITSTVSSTAPKLGARDVGLMAQWKAGQGISVNTSQFNLVGNPAMTLPVGYLSDLSRADAKAKLPVGMQIIGPLYGYAYEKMFDWRKE